MKVSTHRGGRNYSGSKQGVLKVVKVGVSIDLKTIFEEKKSLVNECLDQVLNNVSHKQAQGTAVEDVIHVDFGSKG